MIDRSNSFGRINEDVVSIPHRSRGPLLLQVTSGAKPEMTQKNKSMTDAHNMGKGTYIKTLYSYDDAIL